MAKSTLSFVCQNCGAADNRWQGKCESCGERNRLGQTIKPWAPCSAIVGTR